MLISRVELRAENSVDILPYIHAKQTEKIVVPLDDYLQSVYDRLIEVRKGWVGSLAVSIQLFQPELEKYFKSLCFYCARFIKDILGS